MDMYLRSKGMMIQWEGDKEQHLPQKFGKGTTKHSSVATFEFKLEIQKLMILSTQRQR
jgi:hypothetical protein